jgi:hypothetical protein
LPVSPTAAAPPPVPWKAVALPVEHGGWGFLVEPVLLGLLLAPSTAGFCLAGAAVAVFLARHPLRLVLMDRRKGARHPRTALAERFVLSYAAVAVALVALAAGVARAPFWPAIVLGAPLAMVALVYDLRGRSREALPEAAGGLALGASVAAIALAGGVSAGPAYGAWALLGLRGVTAILYVRARLRLDRGLPAGIPLALASHAGGVAGAVGLAAVGWGPWLGVLALGLMLARAAHGLSSRRPRLRPQALGFREMGWALVALVLLAIGYAFGL